MNTTPKKVLIVDDEPDMIDFLKSLLVDNGIGVVVATNGREALEIAKKEKPDLITLDISMPEESGSRALKNFQESPETSDIPIFIITGISKDYKKFIHNRKVVNPPEAYMEKPVDSSAFLKKVNELLN